MPTPPTLRVRPFRTADREAVRRICCDTAVAGGPVEPLFPDRDAFADFFTRYYTDWEPESAFVAECDGAVVGYLIGCTRHRRYRLVQPALLVLATAPRVAWRLLTGRYGPAARRFLRWFLLRSWRETPAAPPRSAHFHFNVLPGHRNTGAALRLWRAFDRTLAERGVERVYGQIQTGTGDGWRSEKLFARWGFRCLDRRRISKFEGLNFEGLHFEGLRSEGLGDEELYVSTLFREARPAPPAGERRTAPSRAKATGPLRSEPPSPEGPPLRSLPADPRRVPYRGPRSLVVSLHDVQAGSWRDYRDYVEALADLGIHRTSLLVVPRWRDRPLSADPELAQWLRGLAARGHEVVLHGFRHAADGIRGGLLPNLVGRVYTAREGEFYQLGYPEARRRLEEGRRELAAAGLAAEGFVAPAWLLSGLARRAVADLGFTYTTYLHALELLPSGERLYAPSLAFSLRSAWRKGASLSWVPLWYAANRRSALLRVAVHPADVGDRAGRAVLDRLVRSAAADRAVHTYAELVRGQGSAAAA